jgi:PAS domain S-box-containing protein
MDDEAKTRAQLLEELAGMRRRVAALEGSDTLRAIQQWERTFESVPDLIAILDTDYRIVRANRAMAARLQRTPEQCKGLTCYESIHNALQPPPSCPHAMVLADGKGHVAEIHEERLGGDFIVSTTPLADDAGRIIGSVHVARDVTERKKAVEALRDSEERYRGLLEASPDAVVLLTLDGKVLFASRQTWDLLRLSSSDEAIGQSVFDYVIPDDRERLAASVSDLLTVGMRTSTEYTALRRDGTTVPVEVSSAVLRDSAGRPLSVVGVIRDIARRKEAEAALTREREILKRMLEASDHERRLIAYDIHDGLAQQLAAAIMQFQVYDHLKAAQPEEAETAYEGGVALLRQGHGEARRLISGVRPPILDEEGIVAAIAHLIHEQRVPGGPKIEFRSRVEFDRLVSIQENAIYRIVQEGLTNACKHAKSRRVGVELVQRGDVVRIMVRDWGVGFDPDRVGEHCFGLEGIRERARLLGGHCSVETALGGGTRLTVEIPLVLRENSEVNG